MLFINRKKNILPPLVGLKRKKSKKTVPWNWHGIGFIKHLSNKYCNASGDCFNISLIVEFSSHMFFCISSETEISPKKFIMRYLNKLEYTLLSPVKLLICSPSITRKSCTLFLWIQVHFCLICLWYCTEMLIIHHSIINKILSSGLHHSINYKLHLINALGLCCLNKKRIIEKE